MGDVDEPDLIEGRERKSWPTFCVNRPWRTAGASNTALILWGPSMADITFCPPHAAHGIEQSERIQPKSPMAVSARFEADGDISSTGLSFGDYQNMSVRSRRNVEHWRTGIPAFMLDPVKLREVIVRAVEAKAYVNSKSKHIDRSGSLDERLKRAEAKIASMRERKEAVLSNLCSRYVALKSAGDPAAKQLEHQIENY